MIKNRGEHDFTVGDATYTLVLTNADLAALENDMDLGGQEFFERLRGKRARIQHINTVVMRGLANVRPRLTKQEIAKIIEVSPYPARYDAALFLTAGALNFLNEQQDEIAQSEDTDEETGGDRKRPLSSPTADSTGES
jgi:hypothetical protein